VIESNSKALAFIDAAFDPLWEAEQQVESTAKHRA
jgi:hypothetical protein